MRLFTELNAAEQVTIVIIIITHDREVARQCRRRTRILDGALHEVTAGGDTRNVAAFALERG